MNKAVFLDRDGTINVDKNYLYKIEDFEFLPGVIEGLKLLQDAGFLLIIITNQSGIGRGYYTEEQYRQLNNYMLSELGNQGVHIKDVFYCPHHPQAIVELYRKNCNCRKPQLGLFYEAVEKWDIDLSKSWAIGDKERDCSICLSTKCRGILLNDDTTIASSIKGFHIESNLLEAAYYIINKTKD